MSFPFQKAKKIFIYILGFLIISWLGIAIYVSVNQATLKSQILNQINAKINGELSLKEFKTSLFKGFPAISFTMHEVQLKDSLWSQHKHTLLIAKEFDIQLSLWGLMTSNTSINKVKLKNAQVYIYTDSNGYTNTQLFKNKSTGNSPEDDPNVKLPFYKIDVEGLILHIENQFRGKDFEFQISNIMGNFNESDQGWEGKLKLKAKLLNFSFNTNRGSFLKNKLIDGNLDVEYLMKEKTLNLKTKNLKIDKDGFDIKTTLNWTDRRPSLHMQVQAKQVLYADLVSLMAPNIAEKLNKFSIEKPVDVSGDIIDIGSIRGVDPLLKIRLIAKNTHVNFPSGGLDKASFTGFFTNQEDPSKPIQDENSLIQFFQIKANYFSAPIEVDTFSIRNLSRPIASGMVKSIFPLSKLNESLDKNLFRFKKGEAQVQIYCKMDMENLAFTKPDFTGSIMVKNADVSYIPRKINLINSQFELVFNQQDLSLKNARFNWNKSALNVEAEIKNLLNLYYQAPEKINASVKISSNYLSLTEFITFLSPRTNAYVKKKASQFNWIDQLGKVIEESKLHLSLNVQRAQYKKFLASPLKAEISLLNNGIKLTDIRIGHAGGLLALNGSILQTGKVNRFSINSTINKVNVSAFFKAFDSFGQKTLQSKHLTGFLTARVNASGIISSSGQLNPASIQGLVNFKLDKASLNNFEPLEKIQKFAFKNRDFKHIKIDQLAGKLNLNGDKVYINPMQINTSVINFNVEGVYAYNEGTEIAVAVPLRNPKKDEGIEDEELLKRNRMKGLVVRLLAVDDGKGGVKVKWKP
ncbi:MAG: hypothetical protein EOO99_01870 [Pedobacter sp.]|nr:MAG: hypothetical protein EOO99_01870 [Pedobacter sp.]